MIALLSNVNIDPLKLFFRNTEIYLSNYNQIKQELINPSSTCNTPKVTTVLIFLDYNHFMIGNGTSENDYNFIENEFTEILNILQSFLENNPEKKVFINNIAFKKHYSLSYSKVSLNFFHSNHKLNERIYELSQKNKNLYIIDWDKIVLKYGFEKLYTDKYWYIGRIPLTTFGLELYYKEFNYVDNAIKGKVKKVCIVDLDNTLWGGVIGDDGIEGILLGEEGLGKVYRDFQKCIKSLKDIGILLCIVSKNNYEIVSECFQTHPMMILKMEDFIITKINWNNKAENIKEISQELNLGLDSFVFIDDNIFERQIVKEQLPEVSVPEFPDDPYNLVNWFYSTLVPNYFTKLNITEEDLQKHDQYKANLQRKAIEKESLDYNTFINSLEILYTIHLNNRNHIPRIAQLTQKTNQFNLTTKRYTEQDIENMFNIGSYSFFTLEYSDKLGKEGIVALAIINHNNHKAVIDTFLMSCRVIGRFIEFNFINDICKTLLEKGISEIEGFYIPTSKNSLVIDFYSKCGFKITKENYYIANPNEVIQFIEKNYPKLKGELLIG